MTKRAQLSWTRFLATGILFAALAACGGSSSSPPPPTYTVGGTVTGLMGSGLVLQNNGGGDLAVSAPGAFTFTAGLTNGAAYAVTVKTQPSSPTQNCVVTNGSGAVNGNVTNVSVVCTNTSSYTVGGAVSGLVGSGLVLNTGYFDYSNLDIATDGPFTMPGTYASGEAYGVIVYTQPSNPTQYCTVTNGTGNGTVGNASVTTVAIICANVGRFAYVANEGDNTISAYSIDPNTGALTPVVGSPFATKRAHALAVDASGKFLYTANFDSTGVSAYTIDTNTGALTEVTGSPFAAGASSVSVCVDPSGHFVYVANVNSANVSAYTINPATGALTAVSGSPFAAGNSPFSVTSDPTGHFLYVANNGTNNVSAYTIDTSTGALTAVAGGPFASGTGPQSVTVNIRPRAKFVYTANTGSKDVSAYGMDGTTGALSAVAGSPFGAGIDPISVTSDPSGSFLFVANFNGGGIQGASNVSAYVIDAHTGALTAVAGAPFATGMNPSSVSTDPSGKFLYVTNENPTDNTVSAFAIDRSSGALTAVAGSPFAAGHNPQSVAISK